MIERLAGIISSLTLQNVLVMGILVVLAVPSYAVWQFLTDTNLRREILSYAKELEVNVPCQVIVYSFSGQGEKTAVASGVDYSGQFEILIVTRVTGVMSQKELSDACNLMKTYGPKLRDIIVSPEKQ